MLNVFVARLLGCAGAISACSWYVEWAANDEKGGRQKKSPRNEKEKKGVMGVQCDVGRAGT